MKLIDLLVKELPKIGGWPEGVTHLCQGHDFQIEKIGEDGNSEFTSLFIRTLIKGHRKWAQRAYECDAEIVTIEQYEADITALQQPVWNGEGLPPVGCECEGLYDTVDDKWFKVRIIAHDGYKVIGRWLQGLGEGTLFDYVGGWSFRPIRTEAERKRDEFSIALADKSVMGEQWQMQSIGRAIYDAIAAGKIPGVKLE